MMWNKYYIIAILLVVFAIGYFIILKYWHLKRRESKTPIRVTVKKYKFVTTEVEHNHWHSEGTVFVEFPEGTISEKLNCGSMFNPKPFKIGEEIDVYWYASELYYWNAYERGLFRLLPPYG